MNLLDIIFLVAAAALSLGVVAFLVVVRSTRNVGLDTVRENVASTARWSVLLGVVLLANGIIRDSGVDLSWVIGINITGTIHALEGNVVSVIQSTATPALTAYFAFVYVVGYTFLLTFPFVLYLLLDDPRQLRALLVAYVVNYGVGLACYVLFVAYGPRNVIPGLVDSILFVQWPHSQLLTSRVNSNTNVFPSLHTSLSVTVALVAYRTRGHYPRWLPIAALLAASIAVSTMYLGIHWATDVVAGIALAVLSVRVAGRVTGAGPD